MATCEESFIIPEASDLSDELTFEKRKKLDSVEQLVLFQQKIKKKQKVMMDDPLNIYKVQRSRQIKE